MIRMVVLKPKRDIINGRAMRHAIERAIIETARGAKKDFEATTKTWKHRPEFTISGRGYTRTVSTTDQIYSYVEHGTKPHIIAPKNKKVLVFGAGGSAKTTPRVIGSGAGSRGSTVVRTKRVQHPGTMAREFADTIALKWEAEFPKVMDRAVKGAVK